MLLTPATTRLWTWTSSASWGLGVPSGGPHSPPPASWHRAPTHGKQTVYLERDHSSKTHQFSREFSFACNTKHKKGEDKNITIKLNQKKIVKCAFGPAHY